MGVIFSKKPSQYFSSLKAIFFSFLLKQITLHTPISKITHNTSKKKLIFICYILALKIYIIIIRKIYDQNESFIEKLQEIRLKKIFSIAQKTKWWDFYFKKNKINPQSIDLKNIEKIQPITKNFLTSIQKKDLLTTKEDDENIVWRFSGGSTTGNSFSWAHNKSLLVINVLSEFLLEMNKYKFNLKKNLFKNFYLQFNFPHRPNTAGFQFFLKEDFMLRDSLGANFNEGIRKISANLTPETVLRISPPELIFLIEELRRLNLKPKIGFCLVVGSTLDNNVRKMAETFFEAPVIVHYGTQESAPISLECRENKNLYHIFPERVFVEILNESGQKVEAGEIGNVTITCFDNFIMPMIRYQPGDKGILHVNKLCKCGKKTPLLEIKNRVTDIIKANNEEFFSIQKITEEFYKEPLVHLIRRFQINHYEIGKIKILLEMRRESTNIVDVVRTILKNKLENKIRVDIEIVTQIEQKTPKFRMFIPLP